MASIEEEFTNCINNIIISTNRISKLDFPTAELLAICESAESLATSVDMNIKSQIDLLRTKIEDIPDRNELEKMVPLLRTLNDAYDDFNLYNTEQISKLLDQIELHNFENFKTEATELTTSLQSIIQTLPNLISAIDTAQKLGITQAEPKDTAIRFSSFDERARTFDDMHAGNEKLNELQQLIHGKDAFHPRKLMM